MILRNVAVLALSATASLSYAESVVYKMPPKAIADIADAPPTPSVKLDPSGAWLLVIEHPALSTIADLSREELRLAGIRLNPATNARSRREGAIGLRLVRVADGTERAIQGLPQSPRIDDIAFSPDGAHIAFTHTAENGMELWALDISKGATASAKRIASGLNGVFEDPFFWRSDSLSLVARTIPRDRGKAPSAPSVPDGPVVQETTGETAAAWTYQDLLETPHDEDLFEFYGTAQIVEVDLEGKVTPLGAPTLVSRSEPSPNGGFLLVERLERPFSYLVPHERFARRAEIWDRSGKLVREVAHIALAENVPLGRNAVPTGARDIEWRPDEDATLFWVEAQDGGDPKAEASVRDKLFSFSAPFGDEPRELASLGLRFAEAIWGDGGAAILREWWWADRHERLWKVDSGNASVLFDYSYEDRYSVPGRPLVETNARGAEALVTADDGKTIFLVGEGASPSGNRPFVDALDLATGQKTRLFHSEAPFYEYPVAFVDVKSKKLLTRRESIEAPPNYFVRDLSSKELQALTHFPHPYPGLVGATRELVRYDRADGVKLTATLHLPPGYSRERDGALPVFVWAYPIEFKSADAAGQVTESPYRFPRIGWGSPLYWLTQGYAIMENATMPIVGEGKKEPNDTYVEQLVASAQAAVDEAVRRGVADKNRAAIGGHSYGAFMTANLLAHSDIFRAGIARSGAYNRTLTPFGFQSEQRTLWEATDIYVKMSPFLHADQVNEPILLIHGEADNNSGTFPIQSQRFFAALKGHGATTRLVLLPHESHGYRGRESVMHTLWEMNEWLDKWVKHAPPPKGTSN